VEQANRAAGGKRAEDIPVVAAGLEVETEDVGRGKGRKVLCEVAVALV
jgi:hypothetical protein